MAGNVEKAGLGADRGPRTEGDRVGVGEREVQSASRWER